MHQDLTSMNPQTKVLSLSNDLVFGQKNVYPFLTSPHNSSEIVMNCKIKKKKQSFVLSIVILLFSKISLAKREN